jgi:hypothetical protein
MINTALDVLRGQLEAYLELANQTVIPADGFIVLSNVAKQNGEWAIPQDKVGMSLINIEEERVFKEQQFNYRNQNGDFEQYNPEIKLNLYVLFCANFVNTSSDVNYKEGLKQLSYIISFFQGKNVFTPDNTPSMDANLQRLIVELYSYTFEQQYNFWSILGAKYLPSVLYRIRLVTYQEKRLLNQGAPILQMDITGNSI